MIHYLLPQSGRFYKANLHTHTTCSDGCKTPEEIKEIYKAQGYSVVAYTDHDVMIDHSDLNDDGFLAITSHEVETNGPSAGGSFMDTPTYHMNFYAKNPHEKNYVCPNPMYTWGNARAIAETQDYYQGDYVRRYSVEGQNEMIAEARAKGYLVSYNHPDWSLQNYSDYIGLEGITAVEVYNTGCVVAGWVLDEGDHALDHFLKAGKRVYPVATDDNHGNHDMCGGWVRFKAPELSYDAIMTAYEKGDFYASWGPDVEALYLEDGVLKLDATEVVKVALHTSLRCCDIRRSETGMTHAEFDLNAFISEARRLGHGHRAYFRLVLTDARGNRALTRGYFIDELE